LSAALAREAQAALGISACELTVHHEIAAGRVQDQPTSRRFTTIYDLIGLRGSTRSSRAGVEYQAERSGKQFYGRFFVIAACCRSWTLI